MNYRKSDKHTGGQTVDVSDKRAHRRRRRCEAFARKDKEQSWRDNEADEDDQEPLAAVAAATSRIAAHTSRLSQRPTMLQVFSSEKRKRESFSSRGGKVH